MFEAAHNSVGVWGWPGEPPRPCLMVLILGLGTRGKHLPAAAQSLATGEGQGPSFHRATCSAL